MDTGRPLRDKVNTITDLIFDHIENQRGGRWQKATDLLLVDGRKLTPGPLYGQNTEWTWCLNDPSLPRDLLWTITEQFWFLFTTGTVLTYVFQRTRVA